MKVENEKPPKLELEEPDKVFNFNKKQEKLLYPKLFHHFLHSPETMPFNK